MSFHKADSGNINPNFKKGKGYTKNCQTCTLVLNLRLQGYDITAKPYDENNLAQVNLAHQPWIAYKDAKVYSINSDTPFECEKWLEKQLKKGALYTFGYRPGLQKYKHVINVKKNILGNIEFYDPQNGEKLKTREVLKDAYTYKRYYKDGHFPPIIFRTDNKEIDMDFVDKLFSHN